MRWGKALIGLAAVAGLALPLCCCQAQGSRAAKEVSSCCSKKEAPKSEHRDCPCKGREFRDSIAKTDVPKLNATAASQALVAEPVWTSICVWRPAPVLDVSFSIDPDLGARGSPRYLLLEIFRC